LLPSLADTIHLSYLPLYIELIGEDVSFISCISGAARKNRINPVKVQRSGTVALTGNFAVSSSTVSW
jgi:hypothetical protein